MTWRGWEDYVPSLGRGTASKTPMISEQMAEKPNVSSRGTKPARSKYGAVKTDVDGITFDSKREAERYLALKGEQAAGLISGLLIQPQRPLHVTTPQGVKVAIGRYIADFRYIRDGQEVIEDAKGFRGKELYIWKRKHVEAEYGIRIVEV